MPKTTEEEFKRFLDRWQADMAEIEDAMKAMISELTFDQLVRLRYSSAGFAGTPTS